MSLFVELENDANNTLNYNLQGDPETTVCFPIQCKNNRHQIVIYTFKGVEHPENEVKYLFTIDNQMIFSMKQIRTRYVAASLQKELRIIDLTDGSIVRTIDTQ